MSLNLPPKGGFWNSLQGGMALLLMVGCFRTDPNPDRLSGNGSEVENAVVAGRVILANGIASPGALVSLYPADYNGKNDPVLDAKYTVRSDSLGHFRIKGIPGPCQLWGYQAVQGTRFLIQDITVDSTQLVEAGDGTLRAPGRIRVILPEGTAESGYLYIPGTPVAIDVEGRSDSAGALILDSIPAGRIKTLMFGRHNKPNFARVLAKNILIQSGLTTNIPFVDWNYSGTVSVNVSPRIAISSTVTQIPLQLKLDRSNFDFSQARGDGADIRFSKEDGTVLRAQVQAWDSVLGQARVWVRVDSVFADSLSHKLMMYWGNSRAIPGDTAVFDSAEGYMGAWHLDSKPSGFPLAFSDASTAGNLPKAMGILGQADSLPWTGSTEGYSMGGIPLNGKDAYIMGSKNYAGPSNFMVSLWIKTTTTEGGKILGFVMPGVNATMPGKAGNYNFDRVIYMDDDGLVRAGFTMRSSSYPSVLGYWQSFTAARPLNDGKWHHLAYSLWDSGANLVVDGVRASGYSGLVKTLPNAGHWRVGYSGDGKWDPEWTSEYFKGSVDEVRLLHRTRSEDWSKLDYETQKVGSALLSLDKTP